MFRQCHCHQNHDMLKLHQINKILLWSRIRIQLDNASDSYTILSSSPSSFLYHTYLSHGYHQPYVVRKYEVTSNGFTKYCENSSTGPKNWETACQHHKTRQAKRESFFCTSLFLNGHITAFWQRIISLSLKATHFNNSAIPKSLWKLMKTYTTA